MAKSYLNNAQLPKGLRNNNPGNLVITTIGWQGKVPVNQNADGHFEQFVELRYGIRALMRDIITDFKNGKNTISKLINSYAPSFENNTLAYINNVATAIGVAPTTIITLTEEVLVAICKIIITVENGVSITIKNSQGVVVSTRPITDYVTDSDYRDALAILGITLKKKTT